MSNQVQIIQQVLPTIVKNFSQFFELDLTIKLFGVKVFQFHFPPQSSTDEDDEDNNDLPC